jgi:TatD DNase family protein
VARAGGSRREGQRRRVRAGDGAPRQGDRLIDTHCHLGSEAYDADRGQVLQRAWEAGVRHIVVIGESPEAAAAARGLADTEPRLSATAGVHPHDAKAWSPASAAWLAGCLSDPRVVAAGEMGLDYHYDHSPRAAQHAAFRAQLALAADAGRPVIIHARDADDDVVAILREDARTPVVLHSFSSGPALLRAGLDSGHYLSFSGMVTFRNWALDDAVRAVPLERLLIETDGPYLAPVPQRGKRNEPAFVRHTAERIAVVRGMDAAELIEATVRNSVRLFGLEGVQGPG